MRCDENCFIDECVDVYDMINFLNKRFSEEIMSILNSEKMVDWYPKDPTKDNTMKINLMEHLDKWYYVSDDDKERYFQGVWDNNVDNMVVVNTAKVVN